jgi:hypothetical protein
MGSLRDLKKTVCNENVITATSLPWQRMAPHLLEDLREIFVLWNRQLTVWKIVMALAETVVLVCGIFLLSLAIMTMGSYKTNMSGGFVLLMLLIISSCIVLYARSKIREVKRIIAPIETELCKNGINVGS